MILKVVNQEGVEKMMSVYECHCFDIEYLRLTWDKVTDSYCPAASEGDPLYFVLDLDNGRETVRVPAELDFAVYVMNNDGKTIDVIR